MANIEVVSKSSHQVLESINSNTVGVSENSVVKVNVRLEDVASVTREGNSAVITLKNGEKITIEGFYNTGTPDNSLVFNDGNEVVAVIDQTAQGGFSYKPVAVDSLLYIKTIFYLGHSVLSEYLVAVLQLLQITQVLALAIHRRQQQILQRQLVQH